MLAESGTSIIDWEASWAESGTAVAAGMVVAAALAVVMLLVMKKKAEATDKMCIRDRLLNMQDFRQNLRKNRKKSEEH